MVIEECCNLGCPVLFVACVSRCSPPAAHALRRSRIRRGCLCERGRFFFLRWGENSGEFQGRNVLFHFQFVSVLVVPNMAAFSSLTSGTNWTCPAVLNVPPSSASGVPQRPDALTCLFCCCLFCRSQGGCMMSSTTVSEASTTVTSSTADSASKVGAC